METDKNTHPEDVTNNDAANEAADRPEFAQEPAPITDCEPTYVTERDEADENPQEVSDDQQSAYSYSERDRDTFYDDLHNDFSSSEDDGGSTVRFETVVRHKDNNSNTGLKVFFSMLAVVVALIIAVSAGYILGNKQEVGTSFTVSTETTGKSDSDYQSDKSAVFNNVNPSVVGISVYTNKTVVGYASGVVYTEDGYIVTNDHIYSEVSSPEFMVTTYDGSTYKAKFVAGDTRSDLAVLKIDADGLKKATFGSYDEVTVGEEVISIGYSLGISAKSVLTSGTISSAGVRFTSTTKYSMKMIQTDAPINPGNSGGALVNMYSQVIGIPSVKMTGSSYDNVGYAIPSDTVIKVADSLIKHGYVEGRGRLGISYIEVDIVASKINNIPSGLQVEDVNADSDLSGKGIKKGDIITHINDIEIKDSNTALDIIDKTAPGVTLSFTVYHVSDKSTDTVYASLLPDQGNSGYTNKVTEDKENGPFGNEDIDDFFSDH